MKAIINNNEYFSDHYLNASLATDCKPLLDQWAAQAKAANVGLTGAAAKARAPHEMLKGDKSLRSKWEQARASAFEEDATRAWAHSLLTVLGYAPKEETLTILLTGKDEYTVPCILATPDALNPRLVAFVEPGTADDALQQPSPQPGKSWAQLIDDLFNQPQHPRWCLFIQGGCVTLIDYNKWFDKRTLAVSFDELYGAQVDEEYRLAAALLHADALYPDGSSCLLDTLSDNSHKNAHAVSTDLKKALQECIQLLGNEYVWYKRHQTKDAVYAADTDEQAKQIALECLRFMYRLLFCFYLESRPELRFLPMGAEPYLRGYSVDFLRDFEEIALEDEKSQNGYFLDASLRQLFGLIYNGRGKKAVQGVISDDFKISPLKSHLFDPERTPLLSKAHFRNCVLQQIIRKLSIGGHGKSGKGRISYSSLGLNQLGAVYENLLAYSGFFAREELYEVKPAGEDYDPSVHAFFVTADELQEYTESERAKDKSGRYIKHEKGEFIYRLAGRNRKNSASYYTPESLTKCTVQFALKELLKDKRADDILNLKVCEMAVGSAAFLNEAINQLAEAYLLLKQKETGIPVPEIRSLTGQRYVQGHPERVIKVAENDLALFSSLLDAEGVASSSASLARLHTRGQLSALKKIAFFSPKISSLGNNVFSTTYWNETISRKDGTIQRKTCFSTHLILSGPHFHISNPCYKNPRPNCSTNSDYDLLSPDTIADDYRARTNYTPSCSSEEYERRSPRLPWSPSINYIDTYKIAFRRMLKSSNERTLIGVLTCAGTAHVHTVRSLTTAHSVDMLAIASITQSIIGDYYIKLTGAGDLHYQWQQLPLLPPKAAMNLRVLALNCLTVHYDAFWRDVWQDDYRAGRWYGDDARLPRDFWVNLTPEWQRHCALRNDFARRWALCELDVLVAREIGLTLEELCEAYRIQFPVMRQYEADTWYDRNGRVVFTCSKGLVGLGLDRKTWESIKGKSAGFTYAKTYTDNTLPTGPVERTIVYEAPFDRRDREVDYATIWAALDAEENTCK